jgi:hypothetical protein
LKQAILESGSPEYLRASNEPSDDGRIRTISTFDRFFEATLFLKNSIKVLLPNLFSHLS